MMDGKHILSKLINKGYYKNGIKRKVKQFTSDIYTQMFR